MAPAMKTRALFPLAALALWFAACTTLSARTFTDTTGREVEATLLSVKGNKAELKIASTGKAVLFPISKLSKADREYIKLWLEVGGGDKKKEDKTPDSAEKEKTKEKEMSEDEKRREVILKRAKRDKADPLKLNGIVLDTGIWETGISDIERKYRKNGFFFMSATKRAIRSEGKGFTLFGKQAGETVIRSRAGKVSSVNISIYNRGDNGSIGTSAFNALYDNVVSMMGEKTGVRAQDASKTGTVKLVRQMWEWENSVAFLEKSMGSDGKQPEFLRIKMKAKNARSEGMANRSSLRDNVVKDKATGDVYIANVPMIDQGRKGYCAVASSARVYRYYGLDVDQHELAQIAGTGPGSGTSLGEMVEALKKVTRHVRSRVLILYEYPKGLSKKNEDFDYRDYKGFYMEYRRDLKEYNKIAKKRGETEFAESRESLTNPELFRRKCKPEIYREVMTAKSSYPRFNSKIREYIDQGIPVGWCLQLGMFKEGDLPQSFGGHMRLIIGYNKKTDELIYTDSWGNGHGKKRMPAGNAFCMTTAILALPPNK